MRRFHVEAYRRDGSAARIVSDASPWGIGAYLQIDGDIISWYACSIHSDALEYLKITTGSSEGQQTLEALAILVSLRLWKSSWSQVRSTLTAVACMCAMTTSLLSLLLRACAQRDTE